MTPISVKQKLHEYIELADEKKIQAIYTLVENDLDDRGALYDNETINSFRATSEGYFSGKIKGYTAEESLPCIIHKKGEKSLVLLR
jgi:hypothetical protein